MTQPLRLCCRSMRRSPIQGATTYSFLETGKARIYNNCYAKLPQKYEHRDPSERARQQGFSYRFSREFRTQSHRTVTSPVIRRRCYHSQFHLPLPTHEYTNSQVAILSAALKHVPEHGFTLQALTLGARDVGFLDVSVQLLPRREFDLVLFWLASRRGTLRARVEAGLFKTQGTDLRGEVEGTENRNEMTFEEKVKLLVMERLRMNEKIVHKWQDALALMSFPTHIPLSLSELHALSSDMLYLAGDASVDASWYTKRLSLSAIYASAEIIMTQDSGPGFASTEAFVNRRIEDNKAIGEKAADVKRYFKFLAGTAIGLGRSWGLKI